MCLKFKKILSKIVPAIILPGFMIGYNKNANAMRVVDTTSSLKYMCFRHAINANDYDGRWQCAKMNYLDDEVIFTFTRKNWFGQIALPYAVQSFPNVLYLTNSNSSDTLHKEFTLENFLVESQDGIINTMSFCCDCNNKSLVVNFSYPNRAIVLSSNKNKFTKTFNVEDDNYTFAQVFALGISLVMEFIL